MKIGFVLGPQGFKWQNTYYDKFRMTNKTKWLKLVPSKYHINEDGHKWNPKSGDRFIRIDVATAYALKYILPAKHTLDIIPITEVSIKRFRQNDMVITQFMDLLIDPYVKSFQKNDIPHEKLRIVYEKTKDIIYPPMNYTNMIINKCNYYSFLRSKKINIAPTFCIHRKSYDKVQLNKLIKFIKAKKISTLFIKPASGTDGYDIKTIKVLSDNIMKKKLHNFIKNFFKKHKYPGIVFQKKMTGFETKHPQARLYFIGHKHMYTILTDKVKSYRPKNSVPQSYKTMKTKEFAAIKKCLKLKSEKVLKSLSPMFKGYPKLVTRLDFACCLKKSNDNCSNFFVNEIEFNPGLYTHADDRNRFFLDMKIAKQLLKVIKRYQRRRVPFS